MNRIAKITAAVAAGAALALPALAQQGSGLFRPVAVEMQPAPFTQVQDRWGYSVESCNQAPWQIGEGEFTTGTVGASCTFDPETIEPRANRSGLVSIFSTSAECEFNDETETWNYTFMLNKAGDTLWVYGSMGLSRTLKRCSVIAPGGPGGAGENEQD
jgi:hypothetical protein